jgi:hypothetical protein
MHMSRNNLGDLVPMPLPTEWGPTVIPPGTVPPPGSGQVTGGGFTAPGGFLNPFDPSSVTSGSAPNAGGGDDPAGDPYNPEYPGFPYGGGPNVGAGRLVVPYPASVPISPGSSAPGAPWGRQPVLPDALLPPALQRTNPLVGQVTPYRANSWDQKLRSRTALWGWIKAHGGLKSCCRLYELGAPIYDDPPWMVMPSQGEKFEKMFSQPLTAFQTAGIFNGLDVVLGRFTVPNGYDGTVNRFVCRFTGDGFLDFSGSIVWRLKVANRFAHDLGNVTNTFGDFQTAFSVPGTDNIRLISGQTVYLIATIPVGSPVANGVVSAGAFGWYYPRR